MEHGEAEARLERWIIESIEQTLREADYPVFPGLNTKLKGVIAKNAAKYVLMRSHEDTEPEPLR